LGKLFLRDALLIYAKDILGDHVNVPPDFEQRVLHVLRVIQCHLTLLSEDEVVGLWYIPARGFVPQGSHREYCSGGIHLWCGEETRFCPLEVQTRETIRGLRQGALDWAARAHQLEWRQIIYSTGHAIGESLHTIGARLDEAEHAAHRCSLPDVKQHLERARAAKAASVGIGFMSSFLAQASKTPGTAYAWAHPSERRGEQPLCLSKEFLCTRLRETADYAGSYARGGGASERSVSTWLEKCTTSPVYWGCHEPQLHLFQVGVNEPWAVQLTSDVGGAVWAAVAEPLINAMRHNNPEDPFVAVVATCCAATQRIRVVVLNRRCGDPVTNLIISTAETISQRGKVGLTLMGLTLTALKWKDILAWDGCPDPAWYPDEAQRQIPFDFCQPYQVVGFEAPWVPCPPWAH
jgi:hypothetical protein